VHRADCDSEESRDRQRTVPGIASRIERHDLLLQLSCREVTRALPGVQGA
jgi:hypothetical protein